MNDSAPDRFEHIPHVSIGIGTEIHPTAEFGPLRRLVIGDYSLIGPGVRVFGSGELVIGDYAKVHNQTTICAKGSVHLGHVVWVGQESYLDGTGELRVGDFACLGIRTQCFTHARGGDVLEGCIFEGDRTLDIGEDAWLMTGTMVSAREIGARAVTLMGSVVTRPVPPDRIVGGNPAEDVTGKFATPPYVVPTPEERVARFHQLLDTYFISVAPNHDRSRVRVVDALPDRPEPGVTHYAPVARRYTKTHHPEEVALNRWLFGFRAKFRPL